MDKILKVRSGLIIVVDLRKCDELRRRGWSHARLDLRNFEIPFHQLRIKKLKKAWCEDFLSF
jgi:hypothetical protein